MCIHTDSAVPQALLSLPISSHKQVKTELDGMHMVENHIIL